MELELMNMFIAGVFAGGLILGFLFILGKDSGEGLMHKNAIDEDFDPEKEEILDDEHFYKATLPPGQGGHEFPTDTQLDDIAEELDELHRHSQ